MQLTSGEKLSHTTFKRDEMFYADSAGSRQWLVSLKTGKQYPFKGFIEGEDWQRAAKQIERDDAPEPEPESEPIQIVPPRPRPLDADALVRITADEMKVKK